MFRSQNTTPSVEISDMLRIPHRSSNLAGLRRNRNSHRILSEAPNPRLSVVFTYIVGLRKTVLTKNTRNPGTVYFGRQIVHALIDGSHRSSTTCLSRRSSPSFAAQTRRSCYLRLRTRRGVSESGLCRRDGRTRLRPMGVGASHAGGEIFAFCVLPCGKSSSISPLSRLLP